MDELLFHDFESMRRFVRKLNGDESIQRHLRNLQSPDKDERRSAAGSLNYVDPKDELVVSALRKALADPDERVRIGAAESLAKLIPDNDESVRVLVGTLQDADDLVRDDGARTLADLASFAREISPTLADRLRATIPALVEMLGDKNPALRYSASLALRQLGPRAIAAMPALLAAIDDPDHDVRVNAVAAFSFMGPVAHAVVPTLLAILEDPERTPRGTAAQALVSIVIDDPGIPEVIIRALNDLDYDVWRLC